MRELILQKSSYTLDEIAKHLNAEYRGDANCVISGIASLQNAQAGHITFLEKSSYKKYLTDTQASAVILSAENAEFCKVNSLITSNPYLAYAKVAALFEKKQTHLPGIHPTAIIGENCQIDPTASIGPYCVIKENTVIAANSIIGAHCDIGCRSQIGINCRLYPRVTLYADVKMGENVIVHSGVVIGSDGFGNAQDRGQWHKVPHLGGVLIGNNVEIGANTTIDRGALGNTIIGDGVKLDNQIQIGHNVKIGDHTAIAGCVGIAGSAVIGKYCMIGGNAGVNGHIEITDRVLITGMTQVTKSINTPGIYSSGTGMMKNNEWHRSVVRFRHLDELAMRIQRLEKLLSEKETV